MPSSSPCRLLPRYVLGIVLVNVMLGWAAAPPRAAEEIRILVLGDSLTAGYGLEDGDSFPRRLEARLRDDGIAARVINSGVSGDTSAGGLQRLSWALAETPAAVIVELGGNDGLRGLEPELTFANLDAIVGRIRARGARVLLAGMRAPPNLGREYGAEFEAVYERVARRHGVALYPFFLDGVAAVPRLNQTDALHPNARGVGVIVERILAHVKALIAPLAGADG